MKIRKPKIIRKDSGKHNLTHKKVRIGLEVKETLRDDFKMAVTENGENMTEVLADYMDYYIKQTRKKNPHFDEQIEVLDKEREMLENKE
jgi:hypothetical protein